MKFKAIIPLEIEQPHTQSFWKGKDEWLRLTRPETMAFEYNDYTFRLNVNCGYEYDGASIPRFAWSVMGITPFGNAKLAALFHDIFYIWQGDVKLINKTPFCNFVVFKDDKNVESINRQLSDEIFSALLLYSGYKPRQARWAYRALRVGGKPHWGRGLK